MTEATKDLPFIEFADPPFVQGDRMARRSMANSQEADNLATEARGSGS